MVRPVEIVSVSTADGGKVIVRNSGSPEVLADAGASDRAHEHTATVSSDAAGLPVVTIHF